MTDIRKNLIRKATALYLLTEEFASELKWGAARKLTDEEDRIARLATYDVRRALRGREPAGGEPIKIRPDWRDLCPTAEEVDADIRALCRKIAEKGLDRG
jgi:hypothetical protein